MLNVLSVLNRATPPELASLQVILNATEPTPNSLIDALQSNSHHQIHYRLGYRKSYLDLVRQVADHHHISYSEKMIDIEVEETIVHKLLQRAYEQISPAQRLALESEWAEKAQKFDKFGNIAQSAITFSMLTGARLSGFSLYLGASSLVGALTSTIGITLPFVFYTGMSSAIATIIGPPGWIATGTIFLWKMFDPNIARLTSAVLYIAMLRAQQNLDDRMNE